MGGVKNRRRERQNKGGFESEPPLKDTGIMGLLKNPRKPTSAR